MGYGSIRRACRDADPAWGDLPGDYPEKSEAEKLEDEWRGYARELREHLERSGDKIVLEFFGYYDQGCDDGEPDARTWEALRQHLKDRGDGAGIRLLQQYDISLQEWIDADAKEAERFRRAREFNDRYDRL